MRINKYLFPLILLVIFFGVIALGLAAGYWETEGGGRHRSESALPDTCLIAALEPAERSWKTWLL